MFLTIIVWLVILACVAYVAHYIITSFFPEPARTPALAIVGLILLLLVLSQFLPGAESFRLPPINIR